MVDSSPVGSVRPEPSRFFRWMVLIVISLTMFGTITFMTA